MEIILIAALAKNNVIGHGNNIPWHISEDFQHFKERTLGYPCIMGRKTFESLPDSVRPLPKRENIILTSQTDYAPPKITIFHNFDKIIEYCQKKDAKKVFIIGGASVYQLGMKIADTLELTIIDREFKGNVFFPEIDPDQWEIVKKRDSQGINLKTGEHLNFSFLIYKRKNEQSSRRS